VKKELERENKRVSGSLLLSFRTRSSITRKSEKNKGRISLVVSLLLCFLSSADLHNEPLSVSCFGNKRTGEKPEEGNIPLFSHSFIFHNPRTQKKKTKSDRGGLGFYFFFCFSFRLRFFR